MYCRTIFYFFERPLICSLLVILLSTLFFILHGVLLIFPTVLLSVLVIFPSILIFPSMFNIFTMLSSVNFIFAFSTKNRIHIFFYFYFYELNHLFFDKFSNLHQCKKTHENFLHPVLNVSLF